jgi:hypothetical protein
MTKNQAKSLKLVLEKQFGGRAEFEPINRQGRYRFAIRSGKFKGVSHLKRQDEAWRIVDRVLDRDATMDVSMILAFAPGETAMAGTSKHAH